MTDTNQEVRETPAMVPREPTKAMIAAALTVDWSNEDEIASAYNVWQAMLASAPSPAVPDAVGVRVKRLTEALELIARGSCETPAQHIARTALSSIEPTPSPEPQAVPSDVRALVIAARAVAFGDDPSAEAIRALDTASEAFASRVPWEDEP